MGFSGGATFGIQRLIDANARYFGSGLPTYYVEYNDTVLGSQDFAQMGRIYVPTPVSGQALAGTTQTLIDPPPSIRNMSLKQLAFAATIATNLRMGARIFTFSHTWVNSIQTARGYANPRQVFNGTKVVGFLTDGLLFNFESFVHQDVYGAVLNWEIYCNGNEIK